MTYTKIPSLTAVKLKESEIFDNECKQLVKSIQNDSISHY